MLGCVLLEAVNRLRVRLLFCERQVWEFRHRMWKFRLGEKLRCEGALRCRRERCGGVHSAIMSGGAGRIRSETCLFFARILPATRIRLRLELIAVCVFPLILRKPLRMDSGGAEHGCAPCAKRLEAVVLLS